MDLRQNTEGTTRLQLKIASASPAYELKYIIHQAQTMVYTVIQTLQYEI